MTDEPADRELWHRSAELVGVSFPQRTIELIVMPYETETVVPYQGRMVREVIARGAYDGIERRANRVRVNRDHKAERTVGRATAFHPSRNEGLVAEVRIARTELGDETLTLAEDGILDASAGFMPMPGGMEWDGRSKYRVTKAWLGHIAMTPDPAYEDAKVLSVRATQPPANASNTPNLDEVRGWLLEDRLQRGVWSP
jgi:HK97 family phage prohead protease